MDPKTIARARIEEARPALIEISHRIHAHPELGFEEIEASRLLAGTLEGAGFAVEQGVGDLPTAFAARSGPGPLRVAVCAEYDALPEVGHACGHNIIAAAAVGAGLGLAAVAPEVGLEIDVIGTPSEEGGGGKILLLERGAFAGVHAAMMVHPFPFEAAESPIIAASHFEVRYLGREAHAAAYPERGLNAGDALVVAQTAIALLRQQLPAAARVHGIVTRGGAAMNIIPADTAAEYMVRSTTLAELNDVKARVLRCFEAGAVATGCQVAIRDIGPPYAEMRPDPDLLAAYAANARTLGRRLWPDGDGPAPSPVSTDMGNVSLVIPAIHPALSIDSYPAVNHQPGFTAACVTDAADQAVVDGAIAMAWTAIDAATDERLRARLLDATERRPS